MYANFKINIMLVHKFQKIFRCYQTIYHIMSPDIMSMAKTRMSINGKLVMIKLSFKNTRNF